LTSVSAAITKTSDPILHPDVQIVSPDNLNAGYRFVAILEDGRPFEVTVVSPIFQ